MVERTRQTEQLEAERQIQTLLGELAEMAQRISQQLDSRAERLSELIKAADERIEELKRHGGTEARRHEVRDVAASERNEDPKRQVYELADQGAAAQEIAVRL